MVNNYLLVLFAGRWQKSNDQGRDYLVAMLAGIALCFNDSTVSVPLPGLSKIKVGGDGSPTRRAAVGIEYAAGSTLQLLCRLNADRCGGVVRRLLRPSA